MKIGDILIDTDKSEVEILDKTSTSIRLFIKAKNKEKGVDSKDWYLLDKDFDKRFKLKTK